MSRMCGAAPVRTAPSILQMRNGTIQNKRSEQLTRELAERLTHTNGKKVYGYLPPHVKKVVDGIVGEIAKGPRIAEAYEVSLS